MTGLALRNVRFLPRIPLKEMKAAATPSNDFQGATMFANVTRGQHRTALVVLAVVSLAALGACSESTTGPDRAAPLDGMRASQHIGQAAPLDGSPNRQLTKVAKSAPVDGLR